MDDSFLPRIQSVFYAVFDVRQGPKIVCQVPEDLVATLPGTSANPSYASSPVRSSRASSVSGPVAAPIPPSPLRPESRPKFSASPSRTSRTLFYFDDVSKYIIPPSPLCGRLVVCNARQCKIIGFPVELRGNYDRNYFRFNVCFVFNRSADISCYEPIVRKVSRVLTTCEEESAFLSSPETSQNIHTVLEQLYEDLNSYSETSIPIDNFNSIELKLFPFFPNPPPVHDWTVPLALINLTKIIEPNWDLTIAKVCKYIDGTNHVSRIAHLAHCDLELTRQAVAHLLYYQVIMTIDIFQYSNVYTLRKSIQWLADEEHIKDECGPYTVKEGRTIPDWPKLLHLYSRLKPGKTVFEWMQDHDVQSLGIDARRFTSFGVIKGFLRRVHRWPVLLDKDPTVETKVSHTDKAPPSPSGRRRSMSIPTTGTAGYPLNVRIPLRTIRRPSDVTAPLASVSTDPVHGAPSPVARRPSTPSAAEFALGQQLGQKSGSPRHTVARGTPPSPPTVRKTRNVTSERDGSRRFSLTMGPSSTAYDAVQASSFDGTARPQRPRLSRSPSGPATTTQTLASAMQPSTPYPVELLKLLDGEHHTDELCTRFGVGWPTLEQWLVNAGGGKGEGDFGKVVIIYK